MTAGAGVMGFGRRTDQGVGVAVGTTGRTDGDQAAVVGAGGRMQCIPSSLVWQVAQSPPSVKLVPTAVLTRPPSPSWQLAQALWVSAAALTRVSAWQLAQLGRTDRDQGGMVDGRGMLSVPAAGVAGGAVAATARDAGLQGRGGGMTVGAMFQDGSLSPSHRRPHPDRDRSGKWSHRRSHSPERYGLHCRERSTACLNGSRGKRSGSAPRVMASMTSCRGLLWQVEQEPAPLVGTLCSVSLISAQVETTWQLLQS